MNRLVVFGIAIFFAIVGIALLGGEEKASAGHKCNGCDCNGCDCNGGCNGCDCGGRRRKRRNRCNGCHHDDCCGQSACCEPVCHVSCCDVHHDHGKVSDDVKPEPTPAAEGEDVGPPPPPEAGTSIERGPMVYRQVSFRR